MSLSLVWVRFLSQICFYSFYTTPRSNVVFANEVLTLCSSWKVYGHFTLKHGFSSTLKWFIYLVFIKCVLTITFIYIYIRAFLIHDLDWHLLSIKPLLFNIYICFTIILLYYFQSLCDLCAQSIRWNDTENI